MELLWEGTPGKNEKKSLKNLKVPRPAESTDEDEEEHQESESTSDEERLVMDDKPNKRSDDEDDGAILDKELQNDIEFTDWLVSYVAKSKKETE